MVSRFFWRSLQWDVEPVPSRENGDLQLCGKSFPDLDASFLERCLCSLQRESQAPDLRHPTPESSHHTAPLSYHHSSARVITTAELQSSLCSRIKAGTPTQALRKSCTRPKFSSWTSNRDPRTRWWGGEGSLWSPEGIQARNAAWDVGCPT